MTKAMTETTVDALALVTFEALSEAGCLPEELVEAVTGLVREAARGLSAERLRAFEVMLGEDGAAVRAA